MTVKRVKKLSLMLLILPCVAFGIFIGSLVLHVQERLFASYRSNAYLMTTMPTGNFLHIFRGLSSSDDGERIASYYSAGMMKILDSDFIIKRIDAEKNIAAQRVLVYILKEISDKDYSAVIKNHPELKPLEGKIVRNPNDFL